MTNELKENLKKIRRDVGAILERNMDNIVLNVLLKTNNKDYCETD